MLIGVEILAIIGAEKRPCAAERTLFTEHQRISLTPSGEIRERPAPLQDEEGAIAVQQREEDRRPRHHMPAQLLVVDHSFIHIKGDGSMLDLFDRMPGPEGGDRRMHSVQQLGVLEDRAREESRHMLERDGMSEALFGRAHLFELADAGLDPLFDHLREEAALVEEAVEVEMLFGVARLLADEAAYALAELGIVHFIHKMADAIDEEALARREGARERRKERAEDGVIRRIIIGNIRRELEVHAPYLDRMRLSGFHDAHGADLSGSSDPGMDARERLLSA